MQNWMTLKTQDMTNTGHVPHNALRIGQWKLPRGKKRKKKSILSLNVHSSK